MFISLLLIEYQSQSKWLTGLTLNIFLHEVTSPYSTKIWNRLFTNAFLWFFITWICNASIGFLRMKLEKSGFWLTLMCKLYLNYLFNQVTGEQKNYVKIIVGILVSHWMEFEVKFFCFFDIYANLQGFFEAELRYGVSKNNRSYFRF